MKRTGLSVGRAIYQKTQRLVDGRVFPIYADYDTDTPLVVYMRGDLSNEVDKDGFFDEVVHVSLFVIANSYEGSVDLAENVRSAMVGGYEDDELSIDRITLEGADEAREDNKFIQVLNFKIEM